MRCVVKVGIILVLTLLIPLNTMFATSTEDISQDVQLNNIIDELNKYTEDLDLKDISENLLAGEGLEYESIFKKIVGIIKEALIPSVKQVLLILVFVVTVSALKALELDKDGTISKVANMFTVFVVILYLLSVYSEYVTLVKDIVNVQSNIVQIVSPFLMSMLILTGAITTVGIIQPLILFIVQLICFSVNSIVIPLLTVSIVFNIVTCLSDKINFEKLGSMCNKTALWINTIFLTIFLGVVSLGTTVSTSVDDITIKATQTAVSSVIPVVGKFVSDSVEFVMGATELISKTAGVVALIVLVMVVISPLIRIGITALVTSIVTAIAESINADKQVVTMLDKFSSVFKTMLGVAISTSVTFIISIATMMSIVSKIVE